MKKIFFFGVFLLAILPLVASAQEQIDTKPCFEVVGTADYNFGTIEQTASVKHVFEFENKCADTVHISSAQAGCGCTAAVVSEKDIAPGKRAAIEVKFTPPGGSRGTVSKTVSVYLKDNPQPHTVLRFSAKIATDIEANPNYVQLTGALLGKEVSGKITITNVSAEDVELAEVVANLTAYTDTTKGADPNSGGANTVSIPMENVKLNVKTKMLKPNEATDISFTFVPKYAGQVSGSITVKTNKNQTFVQVYGLVKAPESTGQAATPTSNKTAKH